MQSLRTRRPSASNSKPQRQPSKLSKPLANRDARQSRVGDKIKKRMSTRYADISAPQPTENIPAVPGLPIGMRPQHAHTASQGSMELAREKQKEDAHVMENKLLDKQEFDPDTYIKLKLANSTEAELMSLQSHLRTSKDQVASDLQRNVFRNYADFMLVSKEITTLENEMLEFKESLAEWKGMPSLLHIDESSSIADRRRNVRSSVADLRILYANQMQTLHTQIEGSAKYVPTMPGRHIVMEMDGISALNAATYKVDHAVKFVLLDDALLVARRRRRRNNSESEKLVAERCWMLSEMLVLDTKDTQIVTNVFKIRHGKETHVYRTELAADKKSLLSQFRNVAEELAAKKRKEREGEHERRKSLWTTGDRTSHNFEKLPSMPDWMAELAQKAGAGSGSMEDKAEGDARWIGDFADDLTVAIALREWSKAVSLVEQGEEKLFTMPTLRAKLTPLKASLTSALLHSLSSLNNRKTLVVDLISYLLRLGAGPPARSTFLAARTEVTRKRVRMIRFEGAIELYINDLAIVIFTGIKHTADWFLASFKDNNAASCFIEWAKGQIEEYASMFRKQVYTSDVESKTIEDALLITYNQSKKLLEEYGLDFRYLLQSLLVENPKEDVRAQALSRPIPHKPTNPIVTPASSSIQQRSQTPLLPPTPTPNLTVPPTRSSTPRTTIVDTGDQSTPPESPSLSTATSTVPHTAAIQTSVGSTLLPASVSKGPSIRTPRAMPESTSAVPLRATSIAGEPLNAAIRPSPWLRTAALSTSATGGSSVMPPPRSIDRPSSAAGHRPPAVAVPQRNGMI